MVKFQPYCYKPVNHKKNLKFKPNSSTLKKILLEVLPLSQHNHENLKKCIDIAT